MVARGRHDNGAHDPWAWLAEAAARLEETHLVAWSRNLALRERFGLEMAWYLQRMPQTQTCVLAGATIRDLEGFCRQLDAGLRGGGGGAGGGGRPVRRDLHGRGGVIDRLRQRRRELPILGDVDIVKHRYYVWRDADVLLRADARLFGQIADALMGVAAEAEYADEDRLLIHRVVFVGGPALDAYADDERGQFSRWLSPRCGGGRGGRAWVGLTGVEVPPVRRHAIRVA